MNIQKKNTQKCKNWQQQRMEDNVMKNAIFES